MKHSTLPVLDLLKDVRDLLDRIGDLADRTRRALPFPYRNWGADSFLGPWHGAAIRDRPVGLDRMIDRVVSGRLPSRHLERVRCALTEFDQLSLDLKDELLVGVSVGAWRSDVERFYARLAEALDAASAWLVGLDKAERSVSKPPNHALLEQKELLGTKDLAEVLGVGVEQAARRRRSGEFGEVVGGHGRGKFVRSSNVRKALKLPSAAPGDGD